MVIGLLPVKNTHRIYSMLSNVFIKNVNFVFFWMATSGSLPQTRIMPSFIFRCIFQRMFCWSEKKLIFLQFNMIICYVFGTEHVRCSSTGRLCASQVEMTSAVSAMVAVLLALFDYEWIWCMANLCKAWQPQCFEINFMRWQFQQRSAQHRSVQRQNDDAIFCCRYCHCHCCCDCRLCYLCCRYWYCFIIVFIHSSWRRRRSLLNVACALCPTIW